MVKERVREVCLILGSKFKQIHVAEVRKFLIAEFKKKNVLIFPEI